MVGGRTNWSRAQIPSWAACPESSAETQTSVQQAPTPARARVKKNRARRRESTHKAIRPTQSPKKFVPEAPPSLERRIPIPADIKLFNERLKNFAEEFRHQQGIWRREHCKHWINGYCNYWRYSDNFISQMHDHVREFLDPISVEKKAGKEYWIINTLSDMCRGCHAFTDFDGLWLKMPPSAYIGK